MFFCCILSACSSGGSSIPVIPDTEATATAGGGATGGVATGGTSVIQDDGFSDPIYVLQTLSVNGANIASNFATFSDPNCTLPIEIGLFISGFSVQITGVTVPTGQTVSTSLGPAVALNLILNEPTIDNGPIPPELIGLEGFTAEEVFTIAFVSAEDRLFFGDQTAFGTDGSTPETRPTTLDLVMSFGRVP